MQVLTTSEINEVSGADMGGWGFTGSMFSVGAGMIAVCTAPAWGAIGGVLAIGAVGAYAMAQYSA